MNPRLCSLVAVFFAAILVHPSQGVSATSDAARNLLHGDPDFETGLNAWHAFSAPWQPVYLSNAAYPLRNNGSVQPQIDARHASHGARSLRLTGREQFRTYVTGTPVGLDAGATYTFSAWARCEKKGKIRLRIAPERHNKGFYAALAGKEHRVTSRWRQFSVSYTAAERGRIIPVIDLLGTVTCWVDALALTKSATAPMTYTPPRTHTVSIALPGPFVTAMPNLLLHRAGEYPQPVQAELKIYSYAQRPETLKLEVTVEDPEGIIHPVPAPLSVNLAPVTRITLPLALELPPVGIWKLRAVLHEEGASGMPAASAETVLARIQPYTGLVDPFFGTHQKWSPLTDMIGFGAIRDMHLLQWNELQPEPDRWTPPFADELKQIRAFIARGGLYLATLVAEAPKKTRWHKPNWGKTGYGPIPLWAGGDSDTSGGQSKHVSRSIDPAALQSYVKGIVERFPYLALEVMNEPNHYLSVEEYSRILRTVYRTVKSVDPNILVTGFANPPYWRYLPGGHRSWPIPKPYYWFREAFSLGALNNLDAVTTHPYSRTKKGETPETGYGGMGEAAWVAGLAQAMKQHGGPIRPVWVSEKGYSSPSWRKSLAIHSRKTNKRVRSAITQARWIVRSQVDMKAKGIRHYFLFNSVWDEGAIYRYFPRSDRSFALYDDDGLPRPALVAQRTLIGQLSHTEPAGGGDPFPGLRFEVFKGKQALMAVLWRYGKDEEDELSMSALAVKCPDLRGASGLTTLFGVTQDDYCIDGRLHISASPVFIRGGDLDHAETWIRVLSRLGILSNNQ